jgi:hypothetical protein
MDRLSFVPENADKWVHYLTEAADRPVGEVMSEECVEHRDWEERAGRGAQDGA